MHLKMSHEMTRPNAVAERHIAEEITRAVKELGAHGGRVTEEGVHEARRAIKRARAGLKLIREGVPKKRFAGLNKVLREAGRKMSGARDESVLGQTIQGLMGTAGTAGEKKAIEAVRTALHIHPQATGLSASEIGDVVKTLKAGRGRVKALVWKDEDEMLVARGIERTRERCVEAMRAAFRMGTNEAWHTWRKRVQDLKHQLVMLEKVLPRSEAGKIKRMKKLSDLLGLDHDLAVLGERLAEVAGVKLGVRQMVEGMIRQERKMLQKRAKTLGILV